ncbi:MAG: single-stranded DNA-binding protein [Candidatus Thioglobus sp.]|nr:single-stranded DNA-binding protein [Candidatus Thioglobus sp.]
MAGVNKVILVGNLGSKPELKYASNGNAIANFSVATSESWKDKNTGEKQEKTEWHRVSVFGKLAEIAGQYLDKGSKVYVEGSLRTSKYEKNGVDHYSTNVILSGFGSVLQMLDRRDNADGQGSPAAPASKPAGKKPAAAPADPITPVDDSGFDDDIPF